MILHTVIVVACLQLSPMVESAKQQLQLSDSYLPVAMQIIAHLTDQMAYESKDETSTAKPSTKPSQSNNWSQKPTSSWPQKPSSKPSSTWTQKPTAKPSTSWTQKPTAKPSTSWSYTTPKPYVWTNYDSFRVPGTGAFWIRYGLKPSPDRTTPFHKPGIFAPYSPPKPSDYNRFNPRPDFVLLPINHETQYTVIEPKGPVTDEPLLSIHHEEVKPLIEPVKESHLLPPHFETDVDKLSRSEMTDDEENLQYLSQSVRELIKMANDPNDERVVDIWEDLRANKLEAEPKGKMSSSNLRLLLLYDLLSREAKRLRLSDFTGFSPDVMKTLVESSSGGARSQLSMALSKMVERRDCEHEYANNRAREMVAELAKDESKFSAEIRSLQPLIYTY